MIDYLAETTIRFAIGDQSYYIQIRQYDYLYTVSCDNNDVYGEGFTAEEAMMLFINNWENYNQYGPY